MDWLVPVNDMLKDEITKLDHTLLPPGFKGEVRTVRIMQESLTKLIDILGEQSATAQGLNRIITTADKLRNAPSHTLYLLKDSKARSGQGEVIALLKVGRKHLFLFDEHDKVCEVEPLCVLDFFVIGDRQRHGHGKKLFDYMLKDMETSAQYLAIDGPSPKMEQFLARNYGIERLMRQNNNFAVAPQFFEKVAEMRPTFTTPNEMAFVGRFAAPKPPSAIATVIHGGGGSVYHENGNGSDSSQEKPLPDIEQLRVTDPPEVEPRPTERPSSLKVEPVVAQPVPTPPEPAPAGSAPAPASTESAPAPAPVDDIPEVSAAGIIHTPSPAGSINSRRDSQLTDRGFFDVKFYHNKLW